MKVSESIQDLFVTIEFERDLLIFEYMESSLLDELYLAMYGERTVSKIGSYDIYSIAKILVGLYGEKWDNAIRVYLDTIVNIADGGYKMIETENNDTTNSLNRNILNKVSAYNVGDLSESEEDVEELTGTNTGIVETEKQVIRSLGIDSIKKINDYLNSYYIYDIMLLDINNILTLSIYN